MPSSPLLRIDTSPFMPLPPCVVIGEIGLNQYGGAFIITVCRPCLFTLSPGSDGIMIIFPFWHYILFSLKLTITCFFFSFA